MFRVRRFTIVLLAIIAATACAPGFSAVSQRLQVLLDTKVAGGSEKNEPLSYAVSSLYSRLFMGGVKCLPWIGVEYDVSKPMPRVKSEIPEGTLRKQLDKIAADTQYIWQADGEWIFLIPKTSAYDPGYVMNKRMEGRVVLSRDPLRVTPQRDWLKSNRISIARDPGGLRWADKDGKRRLPDPICIDPTTLDNPTLRQLMAVHEALCGNEYWTVQVSTKRDTETGEIRTSILEWGQSLKPLNSESE